MISFNSIYTHHLSSKVIQKDSLNIHCDKLSKRQVYAIYVIKAKRFQPGTISYVWMNQIFMSSHSIYLNFIKKRNKDNNNNMQYFTVMMVVVLKKRVWEISLISLPNLLKNEERKQNIMYKILRSALYCVLLSTKII